MSSLAILGGPPVRTEPWPAWPQHGPEVEEAILRVARSNNYHPQFGDETTAFEKAFAEYHGVSHAVAVGSGTVALQAAMAAAGVGCGDEVIVPAYTYAASASAAVEQNAIPVFVDSDPASQGLDPEDVRRKITPSTKAIVIVHANGYPCDIDAVMAIAGRHGLVVIEDCSHAHGARSKGRLVGTLGHFGAFSLQHKKNLSAGTGGVVITNDSDAADRMRALRSFGWNPIGHNWLISEFNSAIAGAQLPMLDEMNAARRANAAVLVEALGDVSGITPLPGQPDTEPVYYNLILQYDQEVIGAPRKAFVEALKAEGIPVHMFYQPLHRWPIFAEADFYGQGCPFSCPRHSGGAPDYGAVSTPVAEAICDRVNLEIKVQPTADERDMADVAKAVRKVAAQAGALRKVNV